ncbi:hypothetical protein PR001_g8147 [Phytophthora rubi]|uniref:Uncharacterized protein n=1 Tax=Phytophthora rubi TaxID=129364 RepID=A0A6A3N9M8_9STRA|nr:hypothetical protein PR001_g8147 [Phytophthora rubi]
MVSLFECWRATRSKPVVAIGAVTISLWTASEPPPSSDGTRRARLHSSRSWRRGEETHARLSVGDLARSVCEASWEDDRRCGFVRFRLGCRCCRGYNVPRPSDAEWRQIPDKPPLCVSKLAELGHYEAALSEARRATAPFGGAEAFTYMRQASYAATQSRTSARRISRGSQLSGIGRSQRTRYWRCVVLRRRGDEHRDQSAGQHERHRAAGLPTQYAEHCPHRGQEAPNHRAQTDHYHWQDAEVAQRLGRLPAVLKCWSVRTKSCETECHSINCRNRVKPGTLVNGSVAGDERGMVSPQPTDVESRMKPER